MLLTNVVLVLREMLEAALIVSVLLAWSVLHDGGRGWIRSALATGIAGAAVYAANAATVSEWFDYVGMEIVMRSPAPRPSEARASAKRSTSSPSSR